MILEAIAAVIGLAVLGGKKKKGKKKGKPKSLAEFSNAELDAFAAAYPSSRGATNWFKKNLTPEEILTGPYGAGINYPIRKATGQDPLGGVTHGVEEVAKVAGKWF